MSLDYGGGLPGQLETPVGTQPEPEPERPEQARLTPGEWVRENLFNTPFNSVLTVVFGALAGYAIFRGLRFVFVSGRFTVIQANLTNIMVGVYPRDALWRVWVAIYIIAFAAGIGMGVARARRRGRQGWRGALDGVRPAGPALVGLIVLLVFTRTPTPLLLTIGGFVSGALGWLVGRFAFPESWRRRLPLVFLLAVIGAFLAMRAGGGPGLDRWGGFLLTVAAATGGIVLSFPLGVSLGLGRRSTFPLIRTFCVGYIELIRGVPLITLLFIGSVTIGLFLPPGSGRPDLIIRGLVVIIMFTGAYLAETVRGGLQGVPSGQTEAAKAIGLSPLKTTFLIVLPQALRNVIPTLVGQFISLLKDTSLLAVGVGLLELLGITQAILFQGDFRGQGLAGEVLAFAGFMYWVCCYSMSKASQRLEKRLGVGER